MVRKAGFRIQDSGFRVLETGVRSQKSEVRSRSSNIVLALVCIFFCSSLVTRHSSLLFAQQPQTSDVSNPQPLFSINAKYVNGVAPGYWPTAGGGLTLALSAGTAFCGGTVVTYAPGTLTMAASATNYVYLNTASACAPASNTTGFTATMIPIATVVTSSSAITSITDGRTPFLARGVSSFNGRTGAVSPASGDYSDTEITGTQTGATLAVGASGLQENAATLDASTFAGATADAKITTCMANLPAGGGTCDARAVSGSLAANVTVPQNVKLLLGAGPYAAANGVQILYGSNSTIEGIGKYTTAISGNVSGGAIIAPASGGGNNARIANLSVTNNASFSSTTWTIDTTGAGAVRLENVWARTSAANGIKVGGPSYYTSLSNCTASLPSGGSGTGILSLTNQVNIYGGEVTGGAIGIDVEGGGIPTNIIDVDVEGQSTAGYEVGVTATSVTRAIINAGYMQTQGTATCVIFGSQSYSSFAMLPYSSTCSPTVTDNGVGNLVLAAPPASGNTSTGGFLWPGGGGTEPGNLYYAGSGATSFTLRDFSQSSGSTDWNFLNSGGNLYVGAPTTGSATAMASFSRANSTFTANFLPPVSGGLASGTLTPSQSGHIIFNSGAATYTLPSCAQCGYTYTFVVNNSGGITVNAGSGQNIVFGSNIGSSGGSVSSTTVGSTLTVAGGIDTGNVWVVTAVTGNWGIFSGGGSAITSMVIYSTGNITPTAVAANSCSDQTFAVTGLLATDRISQATPPAALGNVSLNAYPSAAGTVLLHFCNPSSSSVTPPAGVYSFLAVH
jgi:hypothetical protein